MVKEQNIFKHFFYFLSMQVDLSLVKHIARAAQLNLTDEECKNFLAEFKEVLSIFEKINSADTKNVKPSFHPVILKNRTRLDSPQDCLSREKALSLTKLSRDEYFLGPKTL